MNQLTTKTVYFDVLERLDAVLEQAGVTSDMERKLKSRDRIFTGISRAISYIVASGQLPVNALLGYVPHKLYPLQDTGVSDYTGLTVYAWPDPANEKRDDGGLLKLILDGTIFEPEFIVGQQLISKRISSLQYQVSNTLMYGPGHINAVVDLSGGHLFVPSGVEAKAQIMIQPDEIATVSFARGKATLTLTGPATADDTITIASSATGTNVTVSITNGDTVEEVAAKITKAINADASIKLNAVVFADEVWLYTEEVGAQAFTTVTVTMGTTGVTAESLTLELEPTETEIIPIDESHRDLVVQATLNHLIGVATGGSGLASMENGLSNNEVAEEAETA